VLESAEGTDDEMSPCSQWLLPRRDFEGLWDSLVLEPNVKERLVEYVVPPLVFTCARPIR